jgi:hypothetical protein
MAALRQSGNRLSSDRRPLVGRRRILHADPEILAALLALPTHPLVERMDHLNCSGHGTIFDAGAAKPAFVGIKYDGRPAFFGIVYHYVHPAAVGTEIAAGAESRINYY